MKGVGSTQELLVTNDEQTTKLYELLGSRFTNHGKLLLPTFRQYESLATNDGLAAVAKEFYRWLGYKPHSVDISYSGASRNIQPVSVTSKTIVIDQSYRDHPLVVGGLLALAVLQQVMAKHHYITDERFTENASIQTGLGLWVANAFQPRSSYFERMYHMLDGRWLQYEGLQLQAYTKGQYLQELSVFTSRNCIFPENYLRGVSKRTMYLFSHPVGTDTIIPLAEPSATTRHLKATRLLWFKIALLTLTLTVIIVTGLFLWKSAPVTLSADQQRDHKALGIIKTSLDDCIKQASDQQSSYDPNDLFMTRQVDVTKSRCESLRNQYNESLDQYEQNYLE